MLSFRFGVVIFILIVLESCLVFQDPFRGLPPGMWRGVLLLETPANIGETSDEEVTRAGFDEVVQGELPFNFEVKYKDDKNFYLEIINGEERIKVEDITMGRDPATAKDTLLIRFPVFDSYIRARFENNALEGEWIVPTRGNYRIPFKALHGKDHRFTQLRKPPFMDISGRWKARFKIDSENPYDAIGEFEQDSNRLTGTFLTETGDYRFLDGTIQDKKIYLSAFDGAHAYLFEAIIQADSSLLGSFYSGKHYKTLWEARRDSNTTLTDPDSLTFLTNPNQKIAFSFPNEDGDLISLNDEKYQGKVKLVQIMGTWCPNCMDETRFLLNFLKKNENSDLAVIALAFEKYRDKEKAFEAIKKYKRDLGIDYEVLLAGYANKKEASEVLNMLNTLTSYPTLIFVDKNNVVRRIHAGFSGPATSKFESFKRNFEEFASILLSEESGIR